jgi:hypothetical protein
MERARALTLSVVAVRVGQELAPSPERSTPYRLSVERFFLDALVARVSKTTDPQVRGYPGRLKAWNARQRGERLTLDHYVKSPVTNGLVGVYATLAQSGRLFNSEFQIESRGFRLLDAWERAGGPKANPVAYRNGNSELHSRLQKAVRKDVEERRFEAGSLRAALFPSCRFDRITNLERQTLNEALFEAENHPQPFVLSLLRKHFQERRRYAAATDSDESERLDRGRIERAIMRRWASLNGTVEEGAIALVARTALVFEELSRYLTAAFDAFRWAATRDCGKPVHFEAISRDRRVVGILKAVLEHLPNLLKRLEAETGDLCEFADAPRVWKSKPLEISKSVDNLIAALRHAISPGTLLETLVARHEVVQRQKRKAAWYLSQAGGYRFYGRYLLCEKPVISQDFLHAYRLVNAASILDDVEN